MNAISDLSPLVDLPLRTLFCQSNPIRDLSPLANVPLRMLNIRDTAPMDAANTRIIQTIPLLHLISDYTASIISAITRIPTLESYNLHRLPAIAPLAGTLPAAIEYWRAGDGAYAEEGPPPEANLRPFAIPAGPVAYLAIPMITTIEQAEAFCRSQGGRMVCPATEVHHRILHEYLLDILHEEMHSYVNVHLGLRYDAETQTISWASGAPYAWTFWVNPGEVIGFRQYRSAYMQIFTNPRYPAWNRGNQRTTGMIVIEWDR
jgi:hypothetical protein